MSEVEEKKSIWIRRHWKLLTLIISASLFIIYSINSVESTRDQYKNEPEKIYEPIFITDEEISRLKEKATLPDDREKIPDIDYEKIYQEVKQGKILFVKLGKNDREVTDYCKLHFSYDESRTLLAKPTCFSLATEQEKIGMKNSFYHIMKGKKALFIEDKPVEEIVEGIIQEKIDENKTHIIQSNQTGKQLEFTLKETVGIQGK